MLVFRRILGLLGKAYFVSSNSHRIIIILRGYRLYFSWRAEIAIIWTLIAESCLIFSVLDFSILGVAGLETLRRQSNWFMPLTIVNIIELFLKIFCLCYSITWEVENSLFKVIPIKRFRVNVDVHNLICL